MGYREVAFAVIGLAIGFILGVIFITPIPLGETIRSFARDYSGFLNFLAALLLVLLTLFYVIFTGRLVAIQIEPTLVLNIEKVLGSGGHECTQVVIQNDGRSPAYDLQFEIDPNNYEYSDGKRIMDLPRIKQGIPYIGSSQKITLYYGLDNSLKQTQELAQVKVIFKDLTNKKHEVLYFVNFLAGTKEYSLRDIAGHLSLIKAEMSEISLAIRAVANAKDQIRRENSRMG